MDRELFLSHLLRATTHCREFTATMIVDTLPSKRAYWVLLNCSCDGNLHPHEVVFPDDVKKHGSRIGPLDAETVVSLLWRDRMVPEWIDIAVTETDESTTYFELRCCGRFTSQSQLLYYTWNETPPFGIKTYLPPGLAMSTPSGVPVEKFRLADSHKHARHLRRGGRSFRVWCRAWISEWIRKSKTALGMSR